MSPILSTKTFITDASGSAVFPDLPPGDYTISTVYTSEHKLVKRAMAEEGSVEWSFANRRGPLPSGANKCNLFVYEMLTSAGYVVPQKPHTKLLGLGATVMLPPNAGDWASSSSTVVKFPVVSLPEPGDIIAWSHAYGDATGHVGIVTYPRPDKPQAKALAYGDDAAVDLTMSRRSISEHGDGVREDTHTFWHYYNEGNATETANILFRRPP